jgi:hypothetical protein
MLKSLNLIRSNSSCCQIFRTIWTKSRSLQSEKSKNDEEISGSIATKFKIFNNSDSGVIYDIEEERSQIKKDTETQVKRSLSYDFNTESMSIHQ